MEPTNHFTRSAEPMYQEALRTLEKHFQEMETDGKPIEEGQRLIEIAEIHLKMHRISQAEKELHDAFKVLYGHSNEILKKRNAIPEVIPRILYEQEHRPTLVTILQTCITILEKIAGICRCASRKREAKKYDKIILILRQDLHEEMIKMSEPQIIPMKVVGTDFIGIKTTPA